MGSAHDKAVSELWGGVFAVIIIIAGVLLISGLVNIFGKKKSAQGLSVKPPVVKVATETKGHRF